ncbi:uncharacterized protein GBIM_10318 [Gryllus bimaculatus]|nr:uncharacterized protein GBIM_10318 [Gryllus bimaculatus]
MVVHVRLRLGELHLVHALAEVPVQEGLAAEHGRELLRHALHQRRDGGRVAHERGRHLEASRGDVAHRRLHVVRDPLHEVRAVLVLHVQHLLVHLLDGHAAAEDGRRRQVAAVARVARRHHVLRVEDLLPVVLAAARRERREARHEEVQARERHHVDRQLAQRRQVVTPDIVTETRWLRSPNRAEADVVQRLVVDAERLVRVLQQQVDREARVPVPPPSEQSQLSASFLTTSSTESINSAPSLLPAPDCPNTKLSGRNSCPNGPARTESIAGSWDVFST